MLYLRIIFKYFHIQYKCPYRIHNDVQGGISSLHLLQFLEFMEHGLAVQMPQELDLGSQFGYSPRVGLSKSPRSLCSTPSACNDGGPLVLTQAHLNSFVPGVNSFRGTPSQALCIPPLKEEIK